NCSSSFNRSRMGSTWRCTYFLLAKGWVIRLTRFGSSPSQKSLGRGEESGSRSVALPDAAASGDAVVLVCWAKAADANTNNRTQPRIFIISTFLCSLDAHADRLGFRGPKIVHRMAPFCKRDGPFPGECAGLQPGIQLIRTLGMKSGGI